MSDDLEYWIYYLHDDMTYSKAKTRRKVFLEDVGLSIDKSSIYEWRRKDRLFLRKKKARVWIVPSEGEAMRYFDEGVITYENADEDAITIFPELLRIHSKQSVGKQMLESLIRTDSMLDNVNLKYIFIAIGIFVTIYFVVNSGVVG